MKREVEKYVRKKAPLLSRCSNIHWMSALLPTHSSTTTARYTRPNAYRRDRVLDSSDVEPPCVDDWGSSAV